MFVGARRALLSGAKYEAEASVLFGAMTSQPGATRKGVINTLIATLKAGGVWTKLDLFYITAAHDSQAGLLNWVSPAAFTLVNVSSVSFEVDRGYTGNGTTNYLRTQYTPSSSAINVTLDSTSIGLWSRTDASNSSPPLGCRTTSTTGQLFFTPRNVATGVHRVNQDAGGSGHTGAASDGHFLAQRTASGATEILRNNVSLTTGVVASTTLPTVEFVLCGLNTAGSVTLFNDYQIAAAYVGASFSSGERTALHNALQAYMTAVGA